MSDKAETRSIIEMVDNQPKVDNRELFDALWSILAELRMKIEKRFQLIPDASSKDLQPYESEAGAKGFLSTYSGPEMDWLVHSWIGTPETSFTNMHLASWLGPQVNVPHLGMALGTAPDIFLYMDFLPRVDLLSNLDYLDKYYEPNNKRFLEFSQRPDVKPFVSKELYMRQSQTHTSLCFMVEPSDKALQEIRTIGNDIVDQWISWVDEAEPTAAEDRAALLERDLLIRRAIADRDPANAIAERLFGKEKTKLLVETLWGANRVNPRPE